MANDLAAGKYDTIPLAAIVEDDTYRYRQDLRPRELADDIASKGQLVPIVVWEKRNSEFTLICGFRRVAAMRLLERDTAEAKILRGIESVDAHRLSLTENVDRHELSNWGRIVAAARMRDEGIKTKMIADVIGQSARNVQRLLKLSECPDDFAAALERNEIGINAAYEALAKGVPLDAVRGRSIGFLRKLNKKTSKKTAAVIKKKRNGGFKLSLDYSPNDDSEELIKALEEAIKLLKS